MRVLISPGYGEGWSTWNDDKEIAFDERIIDAVERGVCKEELKELCEDWGYHDIYMGGFDRLKVVEVPDHTIFRIKEWDGSESIEMYNADDWLYSGKE